MSKVDAMINELWELETELRNLAEEAGVLARNCEDADRVEEFLSVAYEEGDNLHGEIVIAMVGPGVIRRAEREVELWEGFARDERAFAASIEETNAAHMPGRI